MRSVDFASTPSEEEQRLAALYRYDVLDTEPEEAFDRITEMAAYLFDAPLAFVSLIDADRQWMKACVGMEEREIDLDASICVYAIQTEEVTVIPDAAADDRLTDNPFVTGDPGVRFYAGAPLHTSDGYRIGTLCVLDTRPRPDVDPQKVVHLENLAGLVVDELELRREVARRRQRERELKQAHEEADRARAEAEEANETMSRFFAGVAHDLQNPLTSVLMLVELLHTMVEEPAAQYVERVREAGKRMQRMTNSLLDLGRLRSGTLTLETKTEDVAGIAREAISAAQDRPEALGRTARLEVADEPVDALVDGDALRRVLGNLIGNAFKHTTEDDTVWVRIRRATAGDLPPADGEDRDGAPGAADRTLIEVADDGKGIEAEILETIFDPFTRGSDDTEGRGLGLAIAKDLTEAMNGTIDVASELGEGTRFRLTFPAGEG